MSLVTWAKALEEARTLQGDNSDLVARAPDDEAVWSREFDDDYGGRKVRPVLAWTVDRVYFPVVYDGAEWLDSAPRHPIADGEGHVGRA